MLSAVRSSMVASEFFRAACPTQTYSDQTARMVHGALQMAPVTRNIPNALVLAVNTPHTF